MEFSRYTTSRPDLASLSRLFPPLSSARKRLVRAYDVLNRTKPSPPPYEFQNLARWVKTLARLEPIATRGGRWLDVASDPWFCAVAMAEFGRVEEIDLLPTGLERDVYELDLGAGVHYHYESATLQITEGSSDFGLGTDFDLVMALEVIEHLKFHPASFLAAMNAALKPGGALVITTPNVASWASINRMLDGSTPHLTPLYGGDAQHRKEYTVWEMKQLVQAAGFQVVDACTFDCYAGDRRDVRSELHYLGTLAWHGATLQSRRVRNQLTQAGSTMFIRATKVGPCDLTRVASVRV